MISLLMNLLMKNVPNLMGFRFKIENHGHREKKDGDRITQKELSLKIGYRVNDFDRPQPTEREEATQIQSLIVINEHHKTEPMPVKK